MRYLIPIEMLHAHYPSQQMLQLYGLAEYIEIANACMKGDMQGLE